MTSAAPDARAQGPAPGKPDQHAAARCAAPHAGGGPDFLESPEEVLSTLHRDGSRRWLRPRLSEGRFLLRRRSVAAGLICLFVALPWLRIDGKPPILIDLPSRQFTLFGTTFLPTDTLLLALLILSVFLSIFLVTALFGRIWCGWACPQTVYMEFLFRPIERLLEPARYRGGGKGAIVGWRRTAKWVLFVLSAMFVAHTFLAYFVGTDQLFQWMHHSPFKHPTAFVVMLFVTGAMLLDFGVLREQVCTLMCPYGRFQSVLLDRFSLIVGYDRKRGEPRSRRGGRKPVTSGEAAPVSGHCVDCHLCVLTCPTGIDIRNGLQMECIGCAQCIDACDAVMEKVGQPRGLIRYGSQAGIEEGKRRVLRPRVIIYPVLLALALGAFGWRLAARTDVDVTFLRPRGTSWRVTDRASVESRVEFKVTNRSEKERVFTLSLSGASFAGGLTPDPLRVAALESEPVSLMLDIDQARFERGSAPVTLQLTAPGLEPMSVEFRVIGPLFFAPPAPGEGSTDEHGAPSPEGAMPP